MHVCQLAVLAIKNVAFVHVFVGLAPDFDAEVPHLCTRNYIFFAFTQSKLLGGLNGVLCSLTNSAQANMASHICYKIGRAHV